MVNYSAKRTKAQQKRLINQSINKLLIVWANGYHSDTPWPSNSPEQKKIQQMMLDLGRMESKY